MGLQFGDSVIVFISNGRLLWEAILEKLLITIGNLKYLSFQFLGRDKCTAPQVGLKKKWVIGRIFSSC